MLDSRTWWIGFAAFAAVVLGGLAVAGVVDRDLPRVLIDDGGVVSNLTDGAWLAAFGLASLTAAREARAGRPWRAWLLVAALAGVVAWEEAEWSIGGMEHLDLHNRVSLALARTFGRDLTWAVAALASVVVLASAALAAGVARIGRPPGGMGGPIAPHLAVAAGLLAVSAVADVAYESGAFYLTGQWTLEEASELLAAVAVLGAPVRALAGPAGRPSRPGTEFGRHVS
jgi:hypothetical protein